jgi:pimeloyl-ACP methyl ester carboxylesterase
MSEVRLTSLTIESPPPKRTIAVRARQGKSNNTRPGLFWLGGFKSDMQGTKAVALDNWAQAQGRACLRFDYSGHGESGGDFKDGTIGCWLEECLAVYLQFAKGPQVVIGSSMGGWLALLLAQRLRQQEGAAKNGAKIAGMVLIAPAVDFTEELMWKQFPDAIKREIEDKGVWLRPSDYAEGPYPITRALIEDGRRHLMLGGLIETGCPVHILQGVQDPDVPWRHAVELVSRFARDDVVLTLIKDGDHRLSRPEDLERLIAAVKEF